MLTARTPVSTMNALCQKPLVTVTICVYNAGAYLRDAVLSIVNQTYRNLEILIVDDGSTDGCLASIADLRDPRIRIIRQENKGKPAAMNVALSELRGDYYALHDADDLSHPRRIEVLIDSMQKNPDLAAIYSGHELLIGERRLAPTFRSKDREMCREDIARMRMPAHDPTGMYRMTMVGHLRYSTNLLLGEGYDYMLRIGEHWPMMVVGECLYSYRIHDASITRSDPERRTRLVLEVHRRACERRGLQYTPPPLNSNGGKAHREDDNNLAAQFIESVLDQCDAGQRMSAVLTGLQCSRLHSMDFHYYKALAYALMPRRVASWVRQRKVSNGT
jgi:glycosyltransferase involved in cell wall biosynthesis